MVSDRDVSLSWPKRQEEIKAVGSPRVSKGADRLTRRSSSRRPANSSSRVLASLALPDRPTPAGLSGRRPLSRASDTSPVGVDEICGELPDFIQRCVRKNCKEPDFAAARQFAHHQRVGHHQSRGFQTSLPASLLRIAKAERIRVESGGHENRARPTQKFRPPGNNRDQRVGCGPGLTLKGFGY